MQFTGKTVEEATEIGLKELGISKEEADIAVLEQPKKGIFGLGKGKAVVDIVKKSDFELDLGKKKEQKTEKKEKSVKTEKKEQSVKAEKKAKTETVKKQNAQKADALSQKEIEDAEQFVQKLLSIMGLDVKTQATVTEENVVISVTGDSTSSVIGYRGEVLDAIQTITGAFANIGKKDYQKIVVDCENYRDKREETLIALAKRLEAKATEMRREVLLEPMNPFERRIIHTALSKSETVTTRSDGKEPNRYVVIVPNDKDEFAKPYNAGRNAKKGSKGNKGGKGGRHGGRDFKKGGKSAGGEQRKKTGISFGTYLGNSLKDNK